MERSYFAKNLIALRKAKGLSQIDLAERTGISKRMIAYYELKADIPSIEVLKKLATALDIPVGHLVDPNAAKTGVDKVKTWTLKKIQLLEKLPPADQRKVVDFVKALIAKTEKEGAKKAVNS